MKKPYWLLIVLALTLLLFPLSMAYSQNSQGQGFGAREESRLTGTLVVEIVECDCDDCDHDEEGDEEENYQYFLKDLDSTLYSLHLGPKWWRVDNIDSSLFKEGERVEVTGWFRNDVERTIMVSSLRLPHMSMDIRGASGPPPWGQQKELMMDEEWIETGDFH